MTELRRRMDDDMQVRGMADRTRETYLWAVSGLAMRKALYQGHAHRRLRRARVSRRRHDRGPDPRRFPGSQARRHPRLPGLRCGS